MKHITFYFDVISPYAYLAFEQLPKALRGISCSVTYRPVLFAAMLKHHGQLGPAEIAPKRDWTYRHVMWLAQSLGVPMQMPASHPFNPLLLLRLAVACGVAPTGDANRYVCETIFRHVWRGGLDASNVERLGILAKQLSPSLDFQSVAVKDALKRNTDDAIAIGVFGVPTFAVDGKIFWGLDALPMLRGYLLDESWFASGAWQGAAGVPVGANRNSG